MSIVHHIRVTAVVLLSFWLLGSVSGTVEAHGLPNVGLPEPVETATGHALLITFELFNPAVQKCAEFEATVNDNPAPLMGIQLVQDGNKSFCDAYISVPENTIVTIFVSHTIYKLMSFTGILTLNTSDRLFPIHTAFFNGVAVLPFPWEHRYTIPMTIHV